MADPLGNLLGRLVSGLIGYGLGRQQERNREAIAQLNDERINYIANRVYTRMYAMLAHVTLGDKEEAPSPPTTAPERKE